MPPELRGPHRSAPAPENLFKVDEKSPKVDPNLKEQCHTATAKSLHFSQRTKTDLQLSTGFHCTRVRDANEQDVAKFRHLSGCLWLTRYLPLIISIDKDGEAHTCIDSAHAMHSDRRGHSGLYLTMGRGGMINVSKKLGLVTLSSTETEVVADGERIPKCAWFRYFRLAQGDEAKEDALMQDNKSCVQPHKNHPFLVGSSSKHINVRCFFFSRQIR